jgi:uncharacterized protein (DUF58 family)
MHLARRAYLFLLLAAVLAITAIWSDDRALAPLWRLPLALLLLGLAVEGLSLRRVALGARLVTAARAFLGRPQAAAFEFANPAERAVEIEYAPATPPGFEPFPAVRRLGAAARSVGRDELRLTPVRLGPQRWPALPARVLGPLRLAWWAHRFDPDAHLVVAPDTLRSRARRHGLPAGSRPRRVVGAGAELHQLRSYAPGDPLSRIDWKATARTGGLITREFSEDLHLDILIALDAGRFSRVRAGQLDRFGLYANVAARFAEVAVENDDRVGLVVYADRVLAACAPARGLGAVMRLRRALEQQSVQNAESDPTAAAIRIRALLKHRGLVVILTDLDDASVADPLARAVRLLSPPHLAVVAGVRSAEIAALARGPAAGWQDPWIALAATEHEARADAQRLKLQRLGAPVVVAGSEALEQAVFASYEALRRRRRV